MIFLSQRFFQKTNEWIRLYYYDTSGRLVFVRFLEEIEDAKKKLTDLYMAVDKATFHVAICVIFTVQVIYFQKIHKVVALDILLKRIQPGISKFYFMALHFLAKPCRDDCSAKV